MGRVRAYLHRQSVPHAREDELRGGSGATRELPHSLHDAVRLRQHQERKERARPYGRRYYLLLMGNVLQTLIQVDRLSLDWFYITVETVICDHPLVSVFLIVSDTHRWS